MSRLFHALVVFGAGISVSSCGKGQEQGAVGTPSEGAGGDDPGDSGEGKIGVEGSIADGSAVLDAGAGCEVPDSETVAQWACRTYNEDCQKADWDGSNLQAFRLHEACLVDPSRPRTAEDCGPDEWFECLPVVCGARAITVNCACVPMSDAGCADNACAAVGAARVTCIEHSRMCECAPAVTMILVK